MNGARLSTHRVIQLSTLIEVCRASAALHRRVATKAANVGKRELCFYWLGKAQKADSVIVMASRRLKRA